MLELESVIQARLRDLPALVGWQVRGATCVADRRSVPAVDVRMAGAGVPQVTKVAVTLQPAWAITLVMARGDAAAQQLDSALTAVVAALHGWRPEMPLRAWTELQVSQVTEAMFSDAGLVGYEITFTTASVFHGQS